MVNVTFAIAAYNNKCNCCADQLTDQIAIINWWRGGQPGGLQSGFALHLVFNVNTSKQAAVLMVASRPCHWVLPLVSHFQYIDRHTCPSMSLSKVRFPSAYTQHLHWLVKHHFLISFMRKPNSSVILIKFTQIILIVSDYMKHLHTHHYCKLWITHKDTS